MDSLATALAPPLVGDADTITRLYVHLSLGLSNLHLEVVDGRRGVEDPALVHGARVQDRRGAVDPRVDDDLLHLAPQQQVLVEIIPWDLYDGQVGLS